MSTVRLYVTCVCDATAQATFGFSSDNVAKKEALPRITIAYWHSERAILLMMHTLDLCVSTLDMHSSLAACACSPRPRRPLANDGAGLTLCARHLDVSAHPQIPRWLRHEQALFAGEDAEFKGYDGY